MLSDESTPSPEGISEQNMRAANGAVAENRTLIEIVRCGPY